MMLKFSDNEDNFILHILGKFSGKNPCKMTKFEI